MAPIPSSTRTMTYAPVATAGPFPVDFPVFDEDGVDLKVTVDAIERTDWTFVGTLESGFYGAPNTWINGEITFDAPITGALVIKGKRAPRRQAQYAEGRGIPARDHNTEYNILVATDQELRRDIDEYGDRFDDLDEAVSEAQASADLADAAADVAVAAAAVAQDAAADAQAALAQIVSLTFDTRTDLAAATVPVTVKGIRTNGYSAVGDGGGATYVRVASQPAHVASVRSTDRFMPDGSTDATNGGWWVLVTTELYSRQVGVHLSASAAESAFQGFLNAASALNVPARVNRGDVYDFPAGTITLPEAIDLRLHGATLRRTVDLTIPLLECVGTLGTRKRDVRVSGGLLKYTAGTTNTGITNSTALWLKFCRSSHVKDVRIEGAFYIGFRLDDCLDTTLDVFEVWGAYNRALYVAATVYTENVHCLNGLCDGYAFGTSTRLTNHIVNTNGYGTGSGKNITFTNIVARHGSTSPSGEGFAFSENIQDQKAVNCRAEDCPTGFLFQEANGFPLQDAVLVNCTTENCGRGFYGLGAQAVQLDNCRSKTHSIAGFDFENCANIHLGNCRASGEGEASSGIGFDFRGSTGGVKISGCSAMNNLVGFQSAGTTSSIVGRSNYTALNGTGASMAGLSGIDFPTGAGSGNLIL